MSDSATPIEGTTVARRNRNGNGYRSARASLLTRMFPGPSRGDETSVRQDSNPSSLRVENTSTPVLPTTHSSVAEPATPWQTPCTSPTGSTLPLQWHEPISAPPVFAGAGSSSNRERSDSPPALFAIRDRSTGGSSRHRDSTSLANSALSHESFERGRRPHIKQIVNHVCTELTANE